MEKNNMRVIYVSIITAISLLSPIASAVENNVSTYEFTNKSCSRLNVNKVIKDKICLPKGKVYRWAIKKESKPTTIITTPTVVKSLYLNPTEKSSNIEICKIKQSFSRPKFENELLTGFFDSNFKFATKTGTVKWALIPIDFEDLTGEKNFRSRVDDQMQLLSEWYSTVSEGKFNVEWVVADKWTRLPKKTTDYVIPLSLNLNHAANGPKLFKDAMDAADPTFDFTNIQTVNFILPNGQTFIGEGSQGFPWDEAVKDYVSKEGPISAYSIPGQYFDLPGKKYWSYWAHEFGHSIGLPHIGSSHGLMPQFNPLDLMGGQDGPSLELNGWLRFVIGWMPDNKVYCKESNNLKSVSISLIPLSGIELGIKLAIIPLSESKAIMIESRRVTKFSCTTPTLRNGVLVYIYDAKLGHNEDFLIPISPAGRIIEDDSCGELNHRSDLTKDELLHKGDKVTIDGITIEVILHENNLDIINVSR
jgi:M6 family metalloprotease-like protein